MVTKSCTKVLNFSTRFLCENLAAEDFVTLPMGKKSNALHGRLAGRFKPPLAGRCNDFAPSRQKNCHRQKQPSRPGPQKKKTPPRPVPSKEKKKPPRPASEKKTTAPSRLGKKNKPPRPAMKFKIHRPEGGNWKQIPPPVSFSLFLVAHLYRIVV